MSRLLILVLGSVASYLSAHRHNVLALDALAQPGSVVSEVDAVPAPSFNATKPGFVMPNHAEIARARCKVIVSKSAGSVVPKTCAEACATFCTKFKRCSRGFDKNAWENILLPAKMIHFSGISKDGVMSFSEFMTMVPDSTFAFKNDQSVPPEKLDENTITNWLGVKYRYKRRFGAILAQTFLAQGSTIQDSRWEKLKNFVQLDKDHDAILSFPEAFDATPQSSVPDQLTWGSVGLVQHTDLTCLNLPSQLGKEVIAMGGDDKEINSAEWAQHSLQVTIPEFVRRTKIGNAEGKVGSLGSSLKFYQIADLLPHEEPVVVNGQTVEVPAFNTLTESIDRKGILELTDADIKKWLEVVHNMKDHWWFWGDTRKYASKLARNVRRWADAKRPGYTNERIQGPAAQENDQFKDLAPRLAAYIALDDKKDGKLSFTAAAPYIKRALAAPADYQLD